MSPSQSPTPAVSPAVAPVVPSVPGSLLAGAATVDITPAGAVFLHGYPHMPRMSTGVHDPLECAALFVKQGSASALFLANDVIFVPRAVVRRARARIAQGTGVPEAAIMISATHTHSGPVTSDQLSNAADPVVPRADPAYLALLEDRLVEAAQRAVAAAVPAEIGLALARAAGVGTNRHDPHGPADPEVPVLVARDLATATPLAAMVVYAMHPTVLHEDSTLISGDFPAFTRQALREGALPAHCPIVYHNGASGDQSPRHVTRGNTFAEARRLGENLAHAIAAVLPRIEYHRDLAIRAALAHVPLVACTFPPLAEAQHTLDATRVRFTRLQQEGAPRQQVRSAECDVFGAEETVELARATKDGRLAAAIAACGKAEIQAIALGPWRFVAWPGEFFVEYALALKRRAPDTFLVTLANGDLQGYIVTPGATGYESQNAVFAPENGARFIDVTLVTLAHLG